MLGMEIFICLIFEIEVTQRLQMLWANDPLKSTFVCFIKDSLWCNHLANWTVITIATYLSPFNSELCLTVFHTYLNLIPTHDFTQHFFSHLINLNMYRPLLALN